VKRSATLTERIISSYRPLYTTQWSTSSSESNDKAGLNSCYHGAISPLIRQVITAVGKSSSARWFGAVDSISQHVCDISINKCMPFMPAQQLVHLINKILAFESIRASESISLKPFKSMLSYQSQVCFEHALLMVHIYT
jgi:hypothetical protein